MYCTELRRRHLPFWNKPSLRRLMLHGRSWAERDRGAPTIKLALGHADFASVGEQALAQLELTAASAHTRDVQRCNTCLHAFVHVGHFCVPLFRNAWRALNCLPLRRFHTRAHPPTSARAVFCQRIPFQFSVSALQPHAIDFPSLQRIWRAAIVGVNCSASSRLSAHACVCHQFSVMRMRRVVDQLSLVHALCARASARSLAMVQLLCTACCT